MNCRTGCQGGTSTNHNLNGITGLVVRETRNMIFIGSG
ncbi:MAG: ribonuclease P protein subunit [Burkholderiales bacterium]|nr:ribonuclease P protein subunit [Burkholderiales bacterium]